MKKIKPEIWFVIAAIGFLCAWLIDRFAGPVGFNVQSPVIFLKSTILLSRYPLTALAVFIRSVSLFISVMLVMSLFSGKYFTKALALLIVGMVAEFYAIQQLANGFRLITIQWTLSIAYGSILLVFGIFWMILKGIWALFNKGEGTDTKSDTPKSESVLEPSEDS